MAAAWPMDPRSGVGHRLADPNSGVEASRVGPPFCFPGQVARIAHELERRWARLDSGRNQGEHSGELLSSAFGVKLGSSMAWDPLSS